MKQHLQRLCKEAAYAPPSPEEEFIGMQLPCYRHQQCKYKSKEEKRCNGRGWMAQTITNDNNWKITKSVSNP
jgi:hypothetical protein